MGCRTISAHLPYYIYKISAQRYINSGPLRGVVTLASSCIIPKSSVPVACTNLAQFKIGNPISLRILNMIQRNRLVVVVLTPFYVSQQKARGGNQSQPIWTMWIPSQVTRFLSRDIDIGFCTMSEKNMDTNVRVTLEVPTRGEAT